MDTTKPDAEATNPPPVAIGDGARIGLGASILRGVGVGAGAIVEPRGRDARLPAGGHVGGVPAKPLVADVTEER